MHKDQPEREREIGVFQIVSGSEWWEFECIVRMARELSGGVSSLRWEKASSTGVCEVI